MFIRVKTTPNSPRQSIQIVESYRASDGKVKQRIVRHVGVAHSEDELKRLRDLAEYIKSNIENERQPTLFAPEQMAKMTLQGRAKQAESKEDKPLPINDLRNLQEEQRVTLGIHDIYGEVFDQLGFNSFLGRSSSAQKTHEILRDLVLARIAEPKSKRGSVKMLADHFGVEIPLEKAYRALDKLDEAAVDSLQRKALQGAQNLLKGQIDVVFYDATTLYFESFTPDELKQNGYSKDCKFNQPQVLLALFVTQEGLPLGYEVFPGSTYEGHTLITAVEALKSRYDLKNVVFVADSGLLSQDNMELLERHKIDYIVGARLKNLPQKLQASILSSEGYGAAPEEGGRAPEGD